MKKLYTLCGFECSNVAALRMVRACLRVYLIWPDDMSYEDTKNVGDLRYMEYDLMCRIEAERLEYIGVNFY